MTRGPRLHRRDRAQDRGRGGRGARGSAARHAEAGDGRGAARSARTGATRTARSQTMAHSAARRAARARRRPWRRSINYACHATVLEYDNLLYSADFPGQAAAAVERALGGVAHLHAGGCRRHQPCLDAARLRRDRPRRRPAGRGGSARRPRTAAAGRRPLAVNLSWSEPTPKQPAPGTVLQRCPARRSAAVRGSAAPAAAAAGSDRGRDGRSSSSGSHEAGPDDVGSAPRRCARASTSCAWTAPRSSARAGCSRATASGSSCRPSGSRADCADRDAAGRVLRRDRQALEAACGCEHLLICGYANATIGYVATAEQYPQAGYEIGRTRFQPETAADRGARGGGAGALAVRVKSRSTLAGSRQRPRRCWCGRAVVLPDRVLAGGAVRCSEGRIA